MLFWRYIFRVHFFWKYLDFYRRNFTYKQQLQQFSDKTFQCIFSFQMLHSALSVHLLLKCIPTKLRFTDSTTDKSLVRGKHCSKIWAQRKNHSPQVRLPFICTLNTLVMAKLVSSVALALFLCWDHEPALVRLSEKTANDSPPLTCLHFSLCASGSSWSFLWAYVCCLFHPLPVLASLFPFLFSFKWPNGF